MNLDLHTLSIGWSLQRPIGDDDVRRRDMWMERHTDELFALAKEALTARALELAATRKASLRCDE